MWTWNSIFLLATNHLQVWQITKTLKCTMSWKSSVSEVAWFSTPCVLFYINATQYLESHNMWGLRNVEFRIVKLLVCIKNVTIISVTKVPKIGPWVWPTASIKAGKYIEGTLIFVIVFIIHHYCCIHRSLLRRQFKEKVKGKRVVI